MFTFFTRFFKKKEAPPENRFEAYFQRTSYRKRISLDKMEEVERGNIFRERLLEGDYPISENDPSWVWGIVIFFNMLVSVPAVLLFLIEMILNIGIFFALLVQLLIGFVSAVVIPSVIAAGIFELASPGSGSIGVYAWLLFIGGIMVFQVISGFLEGRDKEKARKKREAEDEEIGRQNREKDLADEAVLDQQVAEQISKITEIALKKMGQSAEENFLYAETEQKAQVLSPMISGVLYPDPSYPSPLDPKHYIARYGADNRIRFGAYKISIMIMHETFMYLYECAYDGILNRIVQELGTEFQYKDIVAISVEDRVYKFDKPKPKASTNGKKDSDRTEVEIIPVQLEARVTDIVLKTNSQKVQLGFLADVSRILESNGDSTNSLLYGSSTYDTIFLLRQRVRAKQS